MCCMCVNVAGRRGSLPSSRYLLDMFLSSICDLTVVLANHWQRKTRVKEIKAAKYCYFLTSGSLRSVYYYKHDLSIYFD